MRHGQPRILIGAPVHQRDWILPVYLKRLEELEYPEDLLSFAFVINDSTDESKAILKAWKEENSSRYRQVHLAEKNLGFPPDLRSNRHRDGIFYRLVQARNALLDLLTDEDYLFSIDTDILVQKHTLNWLLANQRDLCSALIFNDRRRRFPNIMKVSEKGNLVHYRDFPRKQLFPVAVTGAVFLASRNLARSTRYSFHPQGEDVAFCLEARRQGYQLWCDSRIRPRHVMYREDL